MVETLAQRPEEMFLRDENIRILMILSSPDLLILTEILPIMTNMTRSRLISTQSTTSVSGAISGSKSTQIDHASLPRNLKPSALRKPDFANRLRVYPNGFDLFEKVYEQPSNSGANPAKLTIRYAIGTGDDFKAM